MAFVYTQVGRFRIPATLDGGMALVQSLSIQFSTTGAFTPADQGSWALVTGQSAFCFLFSLIVVSLFVSLPDIGTHTRPSRRPSRRPG